jgi:serine/threonine-protein kinase
MIGSIVEDRYLVEEELGNGAMGRVFAARHVKVGRRVAIKIMHDELAKNAAIVERFAREAMVAARLRHPNLVSVLDVGQTASCQPLLVLELAPGIPLSHMTCEPLAPSRVINLVRQLLRGLAHAHAAGLIHRDLKPDNILVETTADGVEIPRIVDFGIAVTADRDDSIAGRRLTDANMVIGTPFYMSPEQARAKDIDARTDLFSLGVIMYELLAGMPPFPGSSIDVALANASKDAPTIAERAGIEVDPLLEAFMRKLMSRSLDRRFQSAREALDVLALIELDRMAAARVLGGSPLVDVPRPVFADGSAPHAMPAAPSETRDGTVIQAAAAHREAPALAAPVANHGSNDSARPNSDAMTTITEAADAADDADELDYDPAASLRLRKRIALGFVAAVAAAIVAAFALPASKPKAPSVDVASVESTQDIAIHPAHVEGASVPATSANIVEQKIAAPAPAYETPVAAIGSIAKPSTKVVAKTAQMAKAAPVTSAKTAPIANELVARTAPATKLAKSSITVVPAAAPMPTNSESAVVATQAVLVSPSTSAVAAAPVAVAAPDSVDAVVAKYQAVAKKLKQSAASPETTDLWMRFRLIRINESIASVQGRRQALALLGAIDKAIEN